MIITAESIGVRIAGLRREFGLSQQDIAQWIGCSAGHISNIENEKSELGVSDIETLATKFGVGPLYLLGGIPNNVSEIVNLVMQMEQNKRRLALKLFKLNLEMMEVTKNWPSDRVNT